MSRSRSQTISPCASSARWSTGRPAITPTVRPTMRCCRSTRWPARNGSSKRIRTFWKRMRSSTASTNSACCSTATPKTPIGTARNSRSRRRAASRPTRTRPACRSARRFSPAWSGRWRTRAPALSRPTNSISAAASKFRRPYLGPVIGEYTDWTPLKDRGVLFAEDLDTESPWQFKNVIVR